MAKVLGQSGKYVSEEAARQRRRILLAAFAVIAILGLITGVILSSFLPLQWMDSWVRLAMMSVAMLAIVAVDAWGEKQLEITQKRSDAMLRGAVGEIQVGNILSNLPDDFHVINDLSTPDGNIGHVVSGPTGVFLLEAKSWRGVVSSNGNGELLLNGHPTEMPFIRYFTERAAKIRKRIALTGFEKDDSFNALFVFTAARVDTRQDATGNVVCLADDQLYSYIVERDCGKHLKPDEVNALAQAFVNLTRWNKESSLKIIKPEKSAEPATI